MLNVPTRLTARDLDLSGNHARAYDDITNGYRDVPVYSSQSGKYFSIRGGLYGDVFLAVLIVHEGKIVADPMMSKYQLAEYLLSFDEGELYVGESGA